MLKKIFVFDFSPFDRPGEPELEKRGFVLTFKDKAHIVKMEGWVCEEPYDDGTELLDFWSEMEAYGVHDFGTTGYKEFIGFSSYAVPLGQRTELLEKWREYLIAHTIECGPILDLDPNDTRGDYPDLDLDDTDYSDDVRAAWEAKNK